MLDPSKRSESQSQKLVVLVLSISLTTFLVGGVIGAWAFGKLVPHDTTAAEASKGAGSGKGNAPKAQLVRTGVVEKKPIVPVRALVGDLMAVQSSTIATEVAGKILELPVDEGAKVIGGQTILARIDGTWTALEADKIAAQIAEKKASLTFEKSDYQRYVDLLERNAVSESQTTQKRALMEELEASVQHLEVMLKEVQERKKRLDIVAPFDGTVVSKIAEVGEYVPVGSQIAVIVSTGKIYARVMVPEDNLRILQVGDTIDVAIDSLKVETKGKVSSINAQGSVGSRTFPVRIELDDQAGKLLPGMGASVFVPLSRESTELLVPRDAVLTRPDESTIWVLTEQDPQGTAKSPQINFVVQPVPVRILSHTRDAYAIACVRESDRQLVTPGVQVVTEGLERLVPGALVRVDADKSPLQPVPGTYRTGQQMVDRPGSSTDN
ncbi:efflux RND transporter periplasmic adaptor subunit [Bremerella cremea]|uniref:Efflux RND transporter periplasmic adaptor subunit n=1 Tax=Bremerella cremea TaxID=1031537 RepID=A0A368KPM3_9BACT|nr:efflux RND transporter periplasmic adaptor subunit [Bremerella cremea]RCS47610.1 efflux RND transporter periplasmic adaptor subunit [Bremerella cremea]